MTSSSFRRALAAGALAAAAASCGNPASSTPTVQTLDRPVDLAFACYGRMRLLGPDNLPQATDPVEFQPHPLESCRKRTEAPGTDKKPLFPPGQEDLGAVELSDSMTWFGFALQPVAGTVAVVRIPVKPDSRDEAGTTVPGVASYTAGDLLVLDGDELAPGMNSLSVGSQPIAIATMPSGCHVLTANAGSCDLSVIDVDRIIETPDGLPIVRKQAITTAAGTPLLARPAAMLSDLSQAPIGVECPAEPSGLLYIAYPDCHAVAVVDSATGAAVASIRFAADGTATLGDGNLACPAQCGTPQAVTDGARPVALDLVEDPVAGFRRLAIGLEGHPVVTVVGLDASWLPDPTAGALEQIELEGDVGVTDIAVSRRLGMTGATGFNDRVSILPAEFVYAVVTDGTVRVAEVGVQNTECDTQIDPRFLRAVTDPSQLICFPVGAAGGPPRRALARGPGIQLPGDDFALQVTITRAGASPDGGSNRAADPMEPSPTTTMGHFAFVAGASGTVFVVNIDDDAFTDTWVESAPLDSQLPLVLPHQLRDAVSKRSATGDGLDHALPACDSDGPPGAAGPNSGPPRVKEPPTGSILTSEIAGERGFMLPYIRQLLCSRDGKETAVSELGWAAPSGVRADVFPDLAAVRFDENWSIAWEGSLSRDGAADAVDGPSVRAGLLTVGGGAMNVLDASRPFCAAGVEPYDFVVLRGCDPTRAGQCGLGESCYVHPDSTVPTGACLPTDRAEALGAVCRDFLVSARRYAVQESTASKLVLSERRRVLRTTPIDGCTTVAQCDELEVYEASLTTNIHPKDPQPPIPAAEDRHWACEPDPTRDGRINRCVMTCSATSDCEAGTMCSGGYCIEGPLPPPACIAGLQRYELRGTDAFVVVGDRTGYLHPVVEEAISGRCVRDPAANPLLVGRIPLAVPACTGTEITQIRPNPCKTTIDHTNTVPNYTDLSTCKMGREPATTDDPGEPSLVKKTSTVDAIRFSNPVFTTHLVDTTYPGDAQCLHDRLGMGNRTGIQVVYPGFELKFRVIAGFLAQGAASSVVFPSNLVKTPDGVVWVVDEGDILPVGNTQVNTRGQITRFDPDLISVGLTVR